MTESQLNGIISLFRPSRNFSTLLFPARCLGCESEISSAASQASSLFESVRSFDSPELADSNPPCKSPSQLDSNQSSVLGPEKLAEKENSKSELELDHLVKPPKLGPATKQSISSAKPLHQFMEGFSSHWCVDCWRKLNDHSPRCKKCAATVFKLNPLLDRCALCRDLDLRFESSISISNYRGLIQDLVIRMKNQHDDQLAIQLGRILAYHIEVSDIRQEIDLVVPIPIHRWRRLKRGFNAAEVIAESVSGACGITQSNSTLYCLRGTQKQGTLSTAGRFKNVRNAFGLKRRANVTNLTIMLIDDVMTSGATSGEAARLLLKSGANKVYVGVIARGARVS